jgi:hypothetical protein
MRINNKRVSILPLISGAKLFLIVFAACSVLLYSCKSESDVIGLDVQPLNDIIGAAFVDTTTLITKTVRVDSLRTDETLIFTGESILGTYIDPVFGKTSAALYTQVRLKTLNPSFGTGVIVDSVVLSLVYNPLATHYGKTQRVNQRVNVYQITEDLKLADAYYSNHKLDTLPDDLANGYEFSPKPKDSVSVTGKKYKPQLRIPLSNSFGEALINAASDPTVYSTIEAFQTYMKGLYITTQTSTLNPGDGNIFHFLCADDLSKLTIYYKNDAADSLTFDYALGSVARFSRFTHDYSPTAVNMLLASQLGATPQVQNDVVFVQPMGGLKAKIEMPYLMNLMNEGKIAINKAELVLKVDNTDISYQLDTFAAPARLVLLGINDDNTIYTLPDANEGDSYLGGTYDATNKEYKFNIARYIQQVMSGQKSNNGMYLQVRDGSVIIGAGTVIANRVILGGGGNGAGTNKMKLNISYTKLQ